MHYNQDLVICLEFGPVRRDSVRQGGPRAGSFPLRRRCLGPHPSTFDDVMDFYQGYL